ncbi:MAG: hypothetical protein GEU78_04590 [Actinobacteria bacterium]|nr:hypothetical protein [Actinomycetota bacterium]
MSARFVTGLAASLLIASLTPATAQTTAEALDVRMDLVGQRPWHRPSSELDMDLQLRNVGTEPLDGYNVRVEVHSRVNSRTALHASFDGEAGFQTSSYTIAEPDITLGAGTTHVLSVDDPARTLSSLAAGPDDGGVYPLTLSLYDADGAGPLDTLTTPLILYPERPENPLNLALVVPLSDIPARGPDGVFRQEDGGDVRLDEAIGQSGWLTGLLGSLESEVEKGLHVGLAPSPRLVEELMDMADGYRRGGPNDEKKVGADDSAARGAVTALERLRELGESSSVQVLLTPYANPDLPSLANLPERDWFPEQIKAGEDVLDAAGLSPGRDWIFSPGSRLDAPTLEQLAFAHAGNYTFFGHSSLQPELDPTTLACPEPSPTLACPITVEVPDAVVTGYASDAALQARLLDIARDPSVEAVQRFYAELAMIHTELPGTQRVVQASLPSWQPERSSSSALFDALFDALRRAPWLSTITPAEGLGLDLPVIERTIVPELPISPSAPDASFYESIADANDAVDIFAGIQPPESLVEQLNRNLLVAQSRSWWTDEELLARGMRYAERTRDIAATELDKVFVRAPGEITLTSEEGVITLSLVNEADYPVTVRVVPQSDDVTFDPSSIEDRFEANASSQFRVSVRSQSSGIFPVRVGLETANGAEIRSPLLITVRSTTFNDVAVAITLGALAFLILFYALRGIRKRRRSARPNPEAAAP